ncbi:adenylate kinase 1 [Pyrus ussuriensis x Pyrus communis]|uniref:Adenylate kinase 1 n=1 Tax=Pyrus ussuriensis x Pyrus communis TaxID=2448454 RepID=A0A5N5GLD1_9ROSA|nr:adenylate kinase 1 [Pyrus ussuriensis x Pyrus communis]
MAVLSLLQVVASQMTRRGLGNLERRAYGSAAAQLQYEDHYYYDGQDEEEERRRRVGIRCLTRKGASREEIANAVNEGKACSGRSDICREYLSMGSSVRNLNLQTKEELLKSSPADAEQTKSLEDYYRKQHKLINFQVKTAPGETWRGAVGCFTSSAYKCCQFFPEAHCVITLHLRLFFLVCIPGVYVYV